jgi:hypothetical protein
MAITMSTGGQLYYELSLSPIGAPMDLMTLKATVKQCEYVLASDQDYLRHIYQSERDHRIGMINISVGAN